jgi:hypothetical protein
MSILNLKLTDAKRPLVSETRRKTGREVVLEGIRHQTALLSDPNYKVERVRYAKDADGNYARKPVSAPPKPWWWMSSDGTMCVQIKYGSSTIVELEPGKPTIVTGKAAKDVVSVLEQVADAVKAGKLDNQIDSAKAKAKRRKAGG